MAIIIQRTAQLSIISLLIYRFWSYGNNNQDISGVKILRSKSHGQQHEITLRYDWTNLEPISVLAKKMKDHQFNQCQLPLANFKYHNKVGLGSNLHVWTQGLCHGMEYGYRIRSRNPWTWSDVETCTSFGRSRSSNENQLAAKMNVSSMVCYFPHSELLCPNDEKDALKEDEAGGGIVPYNMTDIVWGIKNRMGCPKLIEEYGIPDIRAAGIEFLFTKVSPIIQKEAERQIQIIFGSIGHVPKNLITVHVRWGDKKAEMKLVDIDEYINAVKTLIGERKKNPSPVVNGDNEKTVNIFLSTEDPKAVEMFKKAAPVDWEIFVDAYYEHMLPHRIDDYNGNAKASTELDGTPGLIALGSLLVAMEANYFVLTTKSNWSRLMNELRKNVIDPRCQNCTRMIDLRDGEW